MDNHITEKHAGQVAAVCPEDPDPQAAAGGSPCNVSEAPLPGATTVTETPPANRLRARPRRERPRPTFVPTQRLWAPEPGQPTVTETTPEALLPDHTLRVEYEIRVLGGNEVVANIKSRFDLPLALKEESLARTDGDFADVFDKIIVAPLLTQVRASLQSRFERYQEARTKQIAPPEAPLPSPHNGQYKSPKPANGTPHEMPEIDPRPPFPRRPGSPM